MKYRILLFGKLPPPHIGPAIATSIILNSKLTNYYDLIHFDISHHKNINDIGKIDLRNLLYTVKQYLKLVQNIIQYKPHLVYIPSQQTTIGYLRDSLFIIIAKLFRKKIVCHLRGAYFRNWYRNECGIVMQWVIKQIQKMIDGQIVLGNNLKQLYEHLMPSNKIFVVHNGRDYIVPTKSENCKNIVKFLFLGNYIKSKGVIDFIESCGKLPKQYLNKVQFYISGNSLDCKEEINQFLNKNPNLPITNLGPVIGKDKKKLFANSDVFVFPTYYRNEGHPWVIVEAIAAGLPVISTEHAAISESVIDGVNGYLVQKKNPQEISEKIIELIENPVLRKNMGENSFNIYKNKFTEEKLVKNFKQVFDKILNNG